MYWILACLLLIFLIYFLVRKGKFNLTPLLSVKIGTIDGHGSYTKFSLLHSDVKSIEYVRLNLHFISKMLLLADGDEKSMIRYFLHKISESTSLEAALREYKKDITILKQTDQFPNNSRCVVATLYYEDIQLRKISTKVPWKILEEQFFTSIVSLLVASLPQIDDYQKKILHVGIRNLNRLFYSNLKDNSIKSSHLYPNIAFNEAVALS